MIYPFKCTCGNEIEVIRPAIESGKPETCFCGLEMERQYTVPQFNVGSSRLNYQKAREEHKEAGGDGNIIELGNESPIAKKEPKSYDFDMSVLNQYPELSQLKD